MEKYRVIFRKDRKSGEILAFFPESYDRLTGRMMCYAHIGQHFEADIFYYWTTKKASPEEYRNLFIELQNYYGRSYAGEEPMQLVTRQRMSYRRA